MNSHCCVLACLAFLAFATPAYADEASPTPSPSPSASASPGPADSPSAYPSFPPEFSQPVTYDGLTFGTKDDDVSATIYLTARGCYSEVDGTGIGHASQQGFDGCLNSVEKGIDMLDITQNPEAKNVRTAFGKLKEAGSGSSKKGSSDSKDKDGGPGAALKAFGDSLVKASETESAFRLDPTLRKMNHAYANMAKKVYPDAEKARQQAQIAVWGKDDPKLKAEYAKAVAVVVKAHEELVTELQPILKELRASNDPNKKALADVVEKRETEHIKFTNQQVALMNASKWSEAAKNWEKWVVGYYKDTWDIETLQQTIQMTCNTSGVCARRPPPPVPTPGPALPADDGLGIGTQVLPGSVQTFGSDADPINFGQTIAPVRAGSAQQ